jgi:hypothetical protein
MPKFMSNDHRDSSLSDSKPIRQGLLRKLFGFPKCSNFFDLFPRQFVQVLTFSINELTLSHAILHVLQMGAKPKMFWTYAKRSIGNRTVVIYLETFWNRASVQNPSNSMGAKPPYRSVSLVYQSAPDLSIAIGGRTSSPEPARISFTDLGPESAWQRRGKTLRSKVLGCNLDHSSVFAARGYWPWAALSFSQEPG